jgi:hypothetical protein
MHGREWSPQERPSIECAAKPHYRIGDGVYFAPAGN